MFFSKFKLKLKAYLREVSYFEEKLQLQSESWKEEIRSSLYLYRMNFVIHASFALEVACLLRQAKIARKPPRTKRTLDQIITRICSHIETNFKRTRP